MCVINTVLDCDLPRVNYFEANAKNEYFDLSNTINNFAAIELKDLSKKNELEDSDIVKFLDHMNVVAINLETIKEYIKNYDTSEKYFTAEELVNFVYNIEKND